jgi:hypothetical protein
LVGWAAEPTSDDWSPPHEKNATDRHPNGAGRAGEHDRGGWVRQQQLVLLDEHDADELEDADEHDDDEEAQVQTGLLRRPPIASGPLASGAVASGKD